MNRILIIPFICICIFSYIQCPSGTKTPLSDEKELLSFVIPNKASSTMIDAEGNLTIKIYEVADVTKLVPIVTVSPKASVFPPSGTIIDFTEPVQYAVTAEDESSKEYMVMVEVSLSDEKELFSFVIPNKMSSAMIDAEGNVIVNVYEPVDITKLIPIVTVSPHASVFPTSGVTVDFTEPVQYTITAQDGSEMTFAITVTVFELPLSNDKEILSFIIPNKMSGMITDADGNVLVRVYEPVDITKLIPLVTVSPNASVFPASGTIIDFTNPVQYTVTAQDGSSKIFTITVERILSSEKELLSFAIPNNASNVVISDEGDVIVKVYEFVDVSNLVPVITVSPNATVFPASGTGVDFTNPVLYTIAAQDESEITFSVTVSKELSQYNEITRFTLNTFSNGNIEQIFEREENNLFIYVPYETDITNIKTNVTVSDKATVSPASGTIKNFTNPQPYTVTASDGTTKVFVVTVKRSPWREVKKNGEAPFLKVDGLKMVVFKDKMWLLGGWLGGENHDKASYVEGKEYWTSQVWSTSDGINWDSEGDADWLGRHGFGCVVFDNKIWVIGGDQHTDVWNSDDGRNWTKVLDVVPWGKRYFPYVVSFKGKIWVMGGQHVDFDGGNFDKYNDVWSTTDGVNWVKETEFVSWVPRGTICGAAVLNNELYIIGGAILYSYAFNDVWKTSDGINWTQVTLHAAWRPKQWHSIASFNNKLWILAGDIDVTWELTNEVWYSSNGINWTQQKGIFWKPTHAAPAVDFNNKLWLVGGLESRIPSRVTNTVRVMELE